MKVVLIGGLAVAVVLALAHGERMCREINAFLDNH